MPGNIPCYQTTSYFSYQAFMDGHYNDLESIRTIGSYEIFSASQNGKLLLFVVEHDIRTARRCEYKDLARQEQDIKMWRRLPPGGDEEASVGARLVPLPPSSAASQAKLFPPNIERRD